MLSAGGTARERQHRQVPGSLDGSCQLTLVARTRTGLSPGFDLASIVQKAAQSLALLIVNMGNILGAKVALPRLAPPAPTAPPVVAISSPTSLISLISLSSWSSL